MRSDRNYKGTSDKRPLLYDARGVRVKSSPLSNKWLRALLFYVLPYIVINGIILILVCSSPSVSIEVQDTADYMSSEVDFTIHSILPLREMTVTLESQPLEYERSGNTYFCLITQNGTFMVQAVAVNGMQVREFEDIAVLDDAAPSIDAETASVRNGTLTFYISDNQSGVDYDSIYAITDTGESLLPTEVDKTLGTVSIALPLGCSSVDLYYEDMVGNGGSGHIDLVTS